MTAFIDADDVALFDLDGVLYLGPDAVAGAPEGVAAVHGRGVRTLYVTNNAAPTERAIAERLSTLGFPVALEDVVTSPQATEEVLRDRLPAGARVLVVGTSNLVDHVLAAGMVPVATSDAAPDAVVMGYDPHLAWADLDEASLAIQRGALWFATNPDLTRPTNRGIVPGLGAMLHAVSLATERSPDVVVGKPHRPLMDEALRRSGGGRAVFVGDRIDTDMLGAHAVGIDSFLVFTGSSGVRHLLEAAPEGRPTAIGWDVGSLLEPPRSAASVDGLTITCRQATVHADGRSPVLEGDLGTREGQLDALWALAQLVWRGLLPNWRSAVDALDLLP